MSEEFITDTIIQDRWSALERHWQNTRNQDIKRASQIFIEYFNKDTNYDNQHTEQWE